MSAENILDDINNVIDVMQKEMTKQPYTRHQESAHYITFFLNCMQMSLQQYVSTLQRNLYGL